MPFDQLPSDDDGDDPSAQLRQWALIRVSFCEMAVASGVDLHVQQARFEVAMVDHAVSEFVWLYGFVPDLGVVGLRLDLVREALTTLGITK